MSEECIIGFLGFFWPFKVVVCKTDCLFLFFTCRNLGERARFLYIIIIGLISFAWVTDIPFQPPKSYEGPISGVKLNKTPKISASAIIL